jgi:hypothetical protein
MSTREPAGFFDRLVAAIPKRYLDEVTRAARRVRDRLPPVVIEHRIDALERHIDRRFKEMEAKLEEIRRASRAA